MNIDNIAEDAYKVASESLYRDSGKSQFATFQDGIHGFDTIRNAIYMSEYETHGFSFITRPKLNLTTTNIRQDRIMSLLDTLDPQTMAFAIRASLDTNLVREYNLSTSNSQFFNNLNPFIPILTNRLVTLNGWPDPTIDVETTDGGYFSESITIPKGHDQLTKNYDISATFNDVQGSPILTTMLMWTRYLALITRGVMMQYMEDIEARRMGFTSSIYRFILDPSNRYITKWAKATGCFPRSVPLGAYFNYDVKSASIESSMNLAIPFSVGGKIEYFDPIILREFNMLVERRCGNIKDWKNARDDERIKLNFKCLPYIDVESGSNELLWKYDPENGEIVDTMLTNLDTYDDKMNMFEPNATEIVA